MKLSKDERDLVKSFLKELVTGGELVKIRGGRYGIPEKMNLVAGTLSCHPSGFGFVIPEGKKEKEDDVYINRRRLAGAMHGDTVVARVEGHRHGERREGSIIRILARAHSKLVGRFVKERGYSSVVPSEGRILEEIIIPPRLAGGAADGDVVEVEITRWPAKHLAPMGRVIEVIGRTDDPDVEIEVIARKFDLPNRFPADVTAEVESVPTKVAEEDIKGRTDLRGKFTVTIDGETAKDFDDAVSIERKGDSYTLCVSIADVSHYVREGTAIDKEAYARGTSVYFPDRCIPMLPEELSNGICSLNPGVDRLAFTAEMEFDNKGIVKGARFYESVIRSANRLTYTEVRDILGGDGEARKKYKDAAPHIDMMGELAGLLTSARRSDGSIDFDLPEPQIIIDMEGRIEDIVRSERNDAHRLIEEFMLAANREVAKRFASEKLPALFRVHDEPDEENVKDFMEFASNLGCVIKKSKGGKVNPKDFQSVIEAVHGRPEERLVNHVLLRSMKQAQYSENNTGHFGLAFADYTHFTSPIRRYPDLVVHRLLKKAVKKSYSQAVREEMEGSLPKVADHTSKRERTAMEAEREIVDLKKAQFMEDKVGEEFSGFVSGTASFGFFVELTEYFVEGLVHVTSLEDDYYNYNEKTHSLVGDATGRSFRPGTEVTVVVTGVDLERRRIEMELAGEAGRSSERRRSYGSGKGKGGGGARGARGGGGGGGGRGKKKRR